MYLLKLVVSFELHAYFMSLNQWAVMHRHGLNGRSPKRERTRKGEAIRNTSRKSPKLLWSEWNHKLARKLSKCCMSVFSEGRWPYPEWAAWCDMSLWLWRISSELAHRARSPQVWRKDLRVGRDSSFLFSNELGERAHSQSVPVPHPTRVSRLALSSARMQILLLTQHLNMERNNLMWPRIMR